MKSWMTNTGMTMASVGGTAMAVANVCPEPKWTPWLMFGGQALLVLGGALGGAGLGRKLNKLNNTAEQANGSIQIQ